MSFTLPAGEIQFTRENGIWKGTARPHGELSWVLSNLPSEGTEFQTTFGSGKPWDTATLRKVTVEENENATRGLAVFHYKTPSTSFSWETTDDDPVYSIRESGLKLPLEDHPDYLAEWNHDFIVKTDGSGNFVSFTYDNTTATNTELTASQSEDLKWVDHGDGFESPDADGEYWGRYKQATKPGVESYIVPGPQVVEERWFSSKSDADNFVGNNIRGTIKTPGETFGITSGQWLIWDMQLTPDEDRWKGTVIYQSARNWDSDLYS